MPDCICTYDLYDNMRSATIHECDPFIGPKQVWVCANVYKM
jgi:hypothetical protein